MSARATRYCDLIDRSEIIPTLEHPARPWHKNAHHIHLCKEMALTTSPPSNNVSRRFLRLPSMIEKREMSEATQQQVH